MTRKMLLCSFVLLGVAVLGFGLAADAQPMSHHLVVQHGQLTWGPAPPVFAAGAELAVVQGDPGGDGFYVVRLRVPDGYKIMPHWHPAAENVTVISGTMHVAAGDKFDTTKGDAIAAGGYVSLPSLMHHYAWSEGPTEIQVHGVAPFALIYLDPKDDPSGMQK